MGTPATATVERKFNWKVLFIKAAGFGAGFAVVLLVFAGTSIWYTSRPPKQKPWNTNALIAEYRFSV